MKERENYAGKETPQERDKSNTKIPDKEKDHDKETRTEERMFVHDVSVSIVSLYPHDLRPSEALEAALACTRGGTCVETMNPLLCETSSGKRLFDNLFWLFFCLKFQPASFGEVGVS